ncbi:hypothetical protein WJ87_05990 [Burkholderia ubonensis]|nr:hypothetical protein WJ87_05990 [Burkholderia ubonensis]
MSGLYSVPVLERAGAILARIDCMRDFIRILRLDGPVELAIRADIKSMFIPLYLCAGHVGPLRLIA